MRDVISNYRRTFIKYLRTEEARRRARKFCPARINIPASVTSQRIWVTRKDTGGFIILSVISYHVVSTTEAKR